MKISIGSDHRGYVLKNDIIKHFSQYQWLDVGAHDRERSDFPIYTKKVCLDVLQGVAQIGIFVCGSGVGPSIAANRHKGIYAALCWNEEVARSAREKNGSNLLLLPADYLSSHQTFSIIESWLGATFQGGRYQERLDMIDQ
ncbi:RpiB/LacA/LacB family sugar-phosphate isomerase [Candidatus Dependentiae bacterium]|jgi:ribose 5-phosphate isomerase B|nr:RpiB/LacA/LacB family sugar-phosphate isomerase [Candidatus Dependentiae bacterium]